MNNTNEIQNVKESNTKQIQINDMKNYLQYRNDELNKELIEKMNKIYQQNEEIKHLEMTVENYKKKFHIYSEKISRQDNLQVEINSLIKRNSDLESQLNLNKMENSKLIEVIKSKDNIIAQFQNLVSVSTEKFKMFEDTHKNLKIENLNLKNLNEELSSKMTTITHRENFNLANIEEMKNIINKKDKEIEKLETELNKTVEKYKTKIEESENNLKNRLKSREEELKNEFIKELSKSNAESEKLILESEKLKLENKNLQKQITNLENSLQEKEFEHKRVVDSKDRDLEKLSKNIKDLHRDLKEAERNYKEKIEDLKNRTKITQQPDEIYKAYLNTKDKQIFELENEVRKLKHTLEFVTSELKEVEIVIDSKENFIRKLKNENAELIKEINEKKVELINEEEDLHIKLETAENRIKLLEREKEILFKEKEEDHKEILNLRSRLTNETKFFENKSMRNYMNIEASPINERSRLENLLTAEKEDQYLAEVSRLQNIILDRDIERDEIKNKFEKRIHSYKLRIEELECRIQNLIKSMSSLKSWACTMERNIAETSVNSALSTVIQGDNLYASTNKISNESHQKQMLESLRDLIANIDTKLNSSEIYLN